MELQIQLLSLMKALFWWKGGSCESHSPQIIKMIFIIKCTMPGNYYKSNKKLYYFYETCNAILFLVSSHWRLYSVLWMNTLGPKASVRCYYLQSTGREAEAWRLTSSKLAANFESSHVHVCGCNPTLEFKTKKTNTLSAFTQVAPQSWEICSLNTWGYLIIIFKTLLKTCLYSNA